MADRSLYGMSKRATAFLVALTCANVWLAYSTRRVIVRNQTLVDSTLRLVEIHREMFEALRRSRVDDDG